MPTEVRLPRLGDSIAYARLSLWLRKEGERVKRGDVLAEVETDKTSVEIESPADGVLSSIVIPAGTEKVAIDALLAVLEADGHGLHTPQDLPSGAPGRALDTPPLRRVADDVRGVPTADQRGAGAGPVGSADDTRGGHLQVDHAPASAAPQTDADVAASPLARRMAFAAGLPLSAIAGSGPGGRVMKADVDAAIAPRRVPTPARAAVSPVSVGPSQADDPSRYTLQPLSAMRRVAAERLTQSKQQVPHFYLRIDCAMDEVARAREQINARVEEKLSFTAFTLRAAAQALVKVPAANVMWADGSVRQYRVVDLAVAVDTPRGLIAPIVRGAEGKSVAALNREVRELAGKARAGTLTPEDYTGGTCTVSNLGMFGVTSLYPIINPPQACILGVGAIEERPVVRQHVLTIGQMMTVTLAADHRALDGATGAAFLAAFRQLIEDPLLLLL